MEKRIKEIKKTKTITLIQTKMNKLALVNVHDCFVRVEMFIVNGYKPTKQESFE